MAGVRLTKRVVEAAEPRERDYDLADATMPGFAIRVRPGGAKSYILRYRRKGDGRSGNSRTLTIGRHPQITPERAREIAQMKLGEIAAGGDPARERPGRDLRTVGEILGAHLKALEGRPSHRVAKYDVKLHLQPALGGKKVAELKADDVEELRDRLVNAGHRRRAGAVVTLLRAALRRAKADDSAAAAVKAPGHRKRKRVANLTELAAVLGACRDLLAEGKIWPWGIYLSMLVLFTGARPSEIRKAKWTDINWRRNLLVRREHKMVRETGEPREIELPEAAQRVLRLMPRINGNPYIIPGKRPKAPLENYAAAWKAITERAKVDGLWLYDGRRTFASVGLGLGFTLEQIGRALGHDATAAVNAYAWLLPEDQKSLSRRVSQAMERLSTDPDRSEGRTNDKAAFRRS